MRRQRPQATTDLIDAILAGTAPDGVRFAGTLDLSRQEALRTLPAGMRVHRLSLDDCPNLTALPADLHCDELHVRRTPLTTFPEDLQVGYGCYAAGCTQLTSLPPNFTTGTLDLHGCTALEALPEGISCNFVNVADCAAFSHWPRRGAIALGYLRLTNCTLVSELPPWLTTLSTLDVTGCVRLTALPDGLTVSSWIDLAGSGLTSLPPSLAGAALRWRGVPISHRIAFQPETITAQEIADEPNVERRRVMVERVGYERYLQMTEATILDADHDTGGVRQLLHIDQGADEDLVLLAVQDPSTGNRYFLRVPPAMTSCQQAAAWVAGFDHPADYHPIVET